MNTRPIEIELSLKKLLVEIYKTINAIKKINREEVNELELKIFEVYEKNINFRPKNEKLGDLLSFCLKNLPKENNRITTNFKVLIYDCIKMLIKKI